MRDHNSTETQDATDLVREALRAHRSGDLTRTETLCRKAVRIDSRHAEAFRLLGLAAFKEGRASAASDYLERAVSLECDQPDVPLTLASLYAQSGDLETAARTLQAALERQGPLAELLLAAGDVASLQSEAPRAEDLYRRCLEADPAHTRAWYNLGVRLADRGAQDEAAEAFARAIKLKPDFADAHFNRALLLSELGDPALAVEHYSEYLRLRPQDTQAKFFRSLERLRAGDYQGGWAEYEARWAHQPDDRDRLPFPRWNGESLSGHRIFVHSEQGLGDEVMFASCFGDLIETAGECFIECDPRLVSLFERSFPEARILPRCKDRASLRRENVDFSLAAGTLPLLFRTSADAFPKRAAFLHAAPDERAAFRARLERLGPGPKIGISWRGGEKPGARKRKSTELAQWTPLLADRRFVFVNLQYDTRPGELEGFSRQCGRILHNFADVDPKRDLDRFAALVAALDLVISVSNTTVHLAGALGVPVWLVLSVAGEWRWQTERDETLWYPSVSIFRQEQSGDWEGVFSRVSQSLQALKTVRLSDQPAA